MIRQALKKTATPLNFGSALLLLFGVAGHAPIAMGPGRVQNNVFFLGAL